MSTGDKKFQVHPFDNWENMGVTHLMVQYIYIILDVLLCSIAEYFYELYRILTSILN